ncbi:MBL fold metallo-hydrolase [Aneurinibacillus thermoaerophilus]|uniref:MBL fold metallo-hydrolase n=1 Tax=Aneurinibacillus thermoaerophilus TaxID=143495 RepID=UPI002E212546|nr:MBL fold metallo-hydrolase [Aneurinibacillus thermoaerophilus]MED0759950.1 MBL fold metallo-hydrolase [Aneurinibacillus thermoaerophilus]
MEQLKQYGVHQVTVPLPFRLNHVHCYLARVENKWTVIDTGLNREETKRTWQAAFREYGIAPEDVGRIILTHYHPDHFGYAGGLQKWTGADVYISETAQDRGLYVWTEENFERNEQFYLAAGMPEELVRKLRENDDAFYGLVRPFPEQTQIIHEGDTYRIGELTYEAIHTPGHAEGHMCFYNKEEKVLLAGDHLLKKITPNISYHGYGDPNPLRTYLASLEKIKTLEISLVVPGHGPVFTDAQERIEELLRHHEERLAFVLEQVRGEMTAYQVSQQLFSRVLTVHEQRFAIGETIAHLSYLEEKGELELCRDTTPYVYKRR